MFYFALAFLIIALIAAAILLVMHFFFKGVKLFKTVNERAEEDDDYFRRVSNKNYRDDGKPKFDSDYFKRKEDSAEAQQGANRGFGHGQPRQGSAHGRQGSAQGRQGNAQTAQENASKTRQRTEHTSSDGVTVTIIDDREMPKSGSRKKFDDEGEYVDFVEES